MLLSAIFIATGAAKLAQPGSTIGYMRAEGVPYAPTLWLIAALVELVGGIALLLGLKARAGGLLLALYLVPVTLMFHDFWAYAGAERQMQMIQFLKNLAIIGGLAYVAVYGAGRLAYDARRRRRGEMHTAAGHDVEAHA